MSEEKKLSDAVDSGDLKEVQKCLANGAGVNWNYGHGWTPLLMASAKGHVDIVKCLLEKGANINATNRMGQSPLHTAKIVDVVKMLLENGANVHATDLGRSTPLHYASQRGHVDVVKMLLEYGANVHASERDEGYTSLHWASCNGHVDVVKCLLEYGPNVNASDYSRDTPLHNASQRGHVDVVKMLLENGANVHATDYSENTPLHYASRLGHVDVVKMLLAYGATVHATNNDGLTPLHAASDNGRVKVVEILLAVGADLFAINEDGKTPRDIAAAQNHIAIVTALDQCPKDRALTLFCDGDHAMAEKNARLVVTTLKLNKSAFGWIGESLRLQRKYKEAKAAFARGLENDSNDLDCALGLEAVQVAETLTPGAVRSLAMAEEPSFETFLNNDEAMAIFRSVVNNPSLYHGHKALLEPVLTYLGALEQDAPARQPHDIAIPTQCVKELYEAVKKGAAEEVQRCVDDGADVKMCGELGESPLHWASWNGDADIVKVLVENCATVDAADHEGETPLHWASMNGHADVVKMLLGKGATTDAADAHGETPLHSASRLGHVVAAEMLLAAEADLFVTSKDGNSPRDIAAAKNHIAIVTALDQCAKARAWTYFCDGDDTMAEKYATIVVTALKLNKSAFAWLGDTLHQQRKHDKAKAAFECGRKKNPYDIDCVLGLANHSLTINVAKVFVPDAVLALAADASFGTLLRSAESMAVFRSVVDSPTLYHDHKPLLEPVFKYLVSLPSEEDIDPVPQPQPSPESISIPGLPKKASLKELTHFLRLPETPTTWRLSEVHHLVTDLIQECNHCVFKAENSDRQNKELVVKLTNAQAEVSFFRRINQIQGADQHVVECIKIYDVALADSTNCFAIVMERGTPLGRDQLKMLQDRPGHRMDYILDIATALLFLHRQKIIHGDVKLENVALFGNKYKLLDFDNSVDFKAPIRHCTHEYCPPEMARCILHGSGTIEASPTFDVWCMGVLVLKLFLKRGDLEEFEGVIGDGNRMLQILAAPGFSFDKSVAKAVGLNKRQKKDLLKCLEPDVSKRSADLNDILTIFNFKSTTTAPLAPEAPVPVAEVPCQLPVVWTIRVLTDEASLPRGRFLRRHECRIGVVNTPSVECGFDEAHYLTVPAESDVVALVLPFVRATRLLLEVLHMLKADKLDVSRLTFVVPDADRIEATVNALEAIHTTATALPTETLLRDYHTRLTGDVSDQEVEEIYKRVVREAMEFGKSSDTIDRVHNILDSMARLQTDKTQSIVGGLVKTGECSWKCHRHGSSSNAPTPLAALAMPAIASDLPLIWSLEPTMKLGNRLTKPSRLRQVTFRLVFHCEWCPRGSQCQRQQGDEAALQVVANSDDVRAMLPILKVSSAVLKALCLAAQSPQPITMDGFQFDFKSVQLGSQIIAALEEIHDPTPSLACQATFDSILNRLDNGQADEAGLVNELQIALADYQRTVLPQMQQVLTGLGIDWNANRLGGLHQDQSTPGRRRWVCDAHSA